MENNTQERIIKMRNKKLSGLVYVNGVPFKCDTTSINSMAAIITETIVNGAFYVSWYCPDKVYRRFTVQEFKPIFKSVVNYQQACHNKTMDLLIQAEQEYISDDQIEEVWISNCVLY